MIELTLDSTFYPPGDKSGIDRKQTVVLVDDFVAFKLGALGQLNLLQDDILALAAVIQARRGNPPPQAPPAQVPFFFPQDPAAHPESGETPWRVTATWKHPETPADFGPVFMDA